MRTSHRSWRAAAWMAVGVIVVFGGYGPVALACTDACAAVESAAVDHPDVEALEAAFASAAAEFGVPADLLKAVAFVESRWVQAGPTIDQGWGIMHLVDNDQARTLQEAAEASGLSVAQLKQDAVANIRGAAALIARDAAKTVGVPERIEDYQAALLRFTGLHPDVRGQQVAEYYRVLAEGAGGANALGMKIALEPVAVDMSLLDKGLAPQQIESTDYGPAIWNPADASNYTASRSASIDRWVNHWIGTGTYAGAISWFKNPSSDVSAHFVCRQSDGELTQMVRIAHTAWHCGNWNSRSIGIEHEATPSYPWPTSAGAPLLVVSSTACRYFCDLYGIPKTRTYIVGHQEVPGSSTSCPGPLPWTTYMDLVNNTAPPSGPAFTNAIANGGFEAGTDSWTAGSSTSFSILTSGAHGGANFAKISRDAAYATIWQNPNETSGTLWRATGWAYYAAGMSAPAFGFKNQSGTTMASAVVDFTSWKFFSVDWTISDDIDVQLWGTGAAGVFLDDVRSGPAGKMNWIPTWLINGTHAGGMATDYLAADGGEAYVVPGEGQIMAARTWTAINQPDGFVNLDAVHGGDVSTCVSYAHIYVLADSPKSNVHLLVGSDDGIKVFLNGAVVHNNDADRSQDYFNPDADDITGLSLQQGENRLMLKVRDNIGAYSFSARFCDADGNAIPGLTYSLNSTVVPDPETILIESRPGGQNVAWYSEEGTWADTNATSTAAGCTASLGSRYGSTFQSVAGLKSALFRPVFTAPAQWRIYATWPTANNRRSPILYRVYHTGGTTDVFVDQTINENTWQDLGAFVFNSGSSGYVRLTNENLDLSGSMYASALKFVKLSDEPPPSPNLVAAVSRKTHNTASNFDVNVKAGSTEGRQGGPTQIVCTFDAPVQALTGTAADVTTTFGTVASVLANGSTLTVNLTGNMDQHNLAIAFPGIAHADDASVPVVGALCVSVLQGDVISDRSVSIFDLLSVRSGLNQALTPSNFRQDVIPDGNITIFDLLSVRSALNRTLPACP